MGFRFRPVDATFYDMFADLAKQLVGGATLLTSMLDEGADRQAVAERMREAEHAADLNTHAIIKRVNSTFVTPFDREDIYALASGLDEVMDHMEEAVDLILLYDVGSLPAESARLVEVIRQCADLTAATMPSLRSTKDLDDYWIEINRVETDVAIAFAASWKPLVKAKTRATTTTAMMTARSTLRTP